MPDFAAIANMKAKEIEKPALPPIGDYILMVINDPAPVDKTSEKGAFQIVEFAVQGVQALESVDAGELKEFGGPKGLRAQYAFVFNRDPEEETAFNKTLYRLTRFLVDVLQAGDENASIVELLGNVKGKTFHGEIGLRQDNRPGFENDFYPEVKKAMPVEG